MDLPPELSESDFFDTFIEPMKGFDVTSKDHKLGIGQLAWAILKEQDITPSKLILSACFENHPQTFSHFLIDWGKEGYYLVLVSDDQAGKWKGWYHLEFQGKYKLKTDQ